jgi:hypothetical protein
MDKDYLKNTKNNLVLVLILIALIVLVAIIFGNPKQPKVPKLLNNQPLVSNEENVTKNT